MSDVPKYMPKTRFSAWIRQGSQAQCHVHGKAIGMTFAAAKKYIEEVWPSFRILSITLELKSGDKTKFYKEDE